MTISTCYYKVFKITKNIRIVHMKGNYPEEHFGFHKICSIGFKPCGIRHISRNQVWEIVWTYSFLEKITNLFLKERERNDW